MSDMRDIMNLLEGVQRGENLEEINRLAKAVAAGSLGLMTALGNPGQSKADTVQQTTTASEIDPSTVSQKGRRFVIAIQDLLDMFEEHHLDVDPEITVPELQRLLAKAERMKRPGIIWFTPDPNKRIAAQIEANMIENPGDLKGLY